MEWSNSRDKIREIEPKRRIRIKVELRLL